MEYNTERGLGISAFVISIFLCIVFAARWFQADSLREKLKTDIFTRQEEIRDEIKGIKASQEEILKQLKAIENKR